MVMRFTDEIDDEDFRPSKTHHPVAQVSDSSSEEDEPFTAHPVEPPPSSTNNRVVVKETSPEDELDDWLNGGEEPAIPAVPVVVEVRPAPIGKQIMDEDDAVIEAPIEVPEVNHRKADRKSKEKKSKRHKTKKSSKDDAAQSLDDEPGRPAGHEEYEEI